MLMEQCLVPLGRKNLFSCDGRYTFLIEATKTVWFLILLRITQKLAYFNENYLFLFFIMY